MCDCRKLANQELDPVVFPILTQMIAGLRTDGVQRTDEQIKTINVIEQVIARNGVMYEDEWALIRYQMEKVGVA